MLTSNRPGLVWALCCASMISALSLAAADRVDLGSSDGVAWMVKALEFDASAEVAARARLVVEPFNAVCPEPAP